MSVQNDIRNDSRSTACATSVWHTGRVHAEWRDGIIVTIYKGKGARTGRGSHMFAEFFAPKVLLDLIKDKFTSSPRQAPLCSIRTRSGVRSVLPDFQRLISVQKAKNYRFWTKIIVFGIFYAIFHKFYKINM